MSIEKEAQTWLAYFNKHHKRTVYGTDGYRNLGLSLETEWKLAQMRETQIKLEHCPSWVGNKRTEP
jgi:hypothetical protein